MYMYSVDLQPFLETQQKYLIIKLFSLYVVPNWTSLPRKFKSLKNQTKPVKLNKLAKS